MKPDRAKEQMLVEQALDEATQAMLLNGQTKRFLWWLFEITGYHSVNLSGNSSVYASEGMRVVGKRIIDQLDKVDPTAYPMMLLEAGRAEQERRSIGDGVKHESEAVD